MPVKERLTNRLELKHRVAGLHRATEPMGGVVPRNVELIREPRCCGSKVLALGAGLSTQMIHKREKVQSSPS